MRRTSFHGLATLPGTAGPQRYLYLSNPGPRGHTLLDRELYLPQDGTNNGARLRAVELASDTSFASKPEQNEYAQTSASW